MKPRIAILSGHHGRGTGASDWNSDEYLLARRDATTLYEMLRMDDLAEPMLEPPEMLVDKAPIARAARWVNANKADCAVEIHYNALEVLNDKMRGNLVAACELTSYVATMDRWIKALPNRHREPIIKPTLILPRLTQCPCVLVEPAFIWEPQIDTPEWSAQVAAAVKAGLYDYLRIDKRASVTDTVVVPSEEPAPPSTPARPFAGFNWLDRLCARICRAYLSRGAK